jgi:hypothetical protein
MARGAEWPEDRKELLRRCIEEKRMPIKDCARVLKMSEPAVRSQARKLGLDPIPPHHFEEPDWDFFESYDKPKLKVV